MKVFKHSERGPHIYRLAQVNPLGHVHVPVSLLFEGTAANFRMHFQQTASPELDMQKSGNRSAHRKNSPENL
jgi:hypothetical protein